MNRFRLVGWLVAAALLVSGCNRSGKPKVAFVSNNPEQFWNIAERGCRVAEKHLNETGQPIEVLFRKPAQGDPGVQKEVIDTVVNQGVKAVAVSVIDPKNQKGYINEIAQKVAFFAVDNDAPDSKRLCYIGTDNYEAGKAVGRLVQECMPEGGTLVVFVGDLAPLNARQRRQGVLDQLAGQKDIEITDGKMYGKMKLYRTYLDQPEGPSKARENAVDAVTALQNEERVCLVGLWAYNPPAILSAVEDKLKDGRIKEGQFKIVAFDEDPRTLEGIANGRIHATVVQDPYLFGFESVKMMAAVARGDRSKIPANGLYPIDFRIITRDGGKEYPEVVNGVKKSIPVQQFRDELKKLMGEK